MNAGVLRTARAGLAAPALVVLVALAGCAGAPERAASGGPTFYDCVTEIVQAVAGYDDLDNQATGASCTVVVGTDAGDVLTPGRHRNVVQVVSPNGERRKQYAGTYTDCVELLTGPTGSEECLAIDGPYPLHRLGLGPDGAVESLEIP